ncbi:MULTISPECIES: aminopeptidase P family protein [unclassified Kitasatospora]|uniref:aminopeptidase P family protein n=1 Tax=unclassified Kitasatospora TaxID=2633591 RepID=UPI0007105426|nr:MULTISPECIES: aminopeptidase P family protein [unclassified Kitasatospora]KQV15446.1 Xaa-Pro aminopeptidase [Kitasatospora sp. Root107]KRB63966.1 Xaa-Pro aminopeptidase [Kitasatospora sp. Root187]
MTEDRSPAAAENPEGAAGGDETEEQPIKGRKNGLYGEISDELATSMKSGWADTELRGLEPVAQAPYAAERRAKLSAAFPGERLVIPAGNLHTRANDTEYSFRAASEYVHLTGDQTEDAVLVAEPVDGGHEFSLYLLPRSNRENGEFWLDGNGELWVGRRNSLTEAEQLLGLPCRDVRKAAEELQAAPAAPTRIVRQYDAGLEAALAEVLDEDRDEEFKVFLSGLRLVKDDWEITQLRAACDATVNGFTDVVRELGQAVATSERWIEGTFWRRARVEGNDIGYGSICAAGPHATTLHWVRNDGDVRPGELLLLDAGVETHTLYTADVTRTLPINGRFNALQRKIYEAVYDAQEAGIAAVKPGGRFRDFHDASQRVLAERLLAWGLLDASVYDVEKVLELGLQRRWTLHGTGHMLGLDVHDCAQARRESYVDALLEPGMCLTVEPGLYFQLDDLTVPEEYRGIGVRIEDDILVTADGNENLSAGLPRRADEVEAWMAELSS